MDETTRMLRTLSQKSVSGPKLDLVIPNHSGDLSAGNVFTTPTHNEDVVNKSYVDASSVLSFNNARYMIPYHSGIATTSQTATVARVMLHLIEVPRACTVDAVMINNAGTVAGNVTVGLYGPVSLTTDTCEGSSLVAESASTAQSGTNTGQAITFPSPVSINAGKYYVAVEYSDATATYLRHGNTVQIVGWVQYYNRAGGYGALTNPCPAVTDTGSAAVGIRLRRSA